MAATARSCSRRNEQHAGWADVVVDGICHFPGCVCFVSFQFPEPPRCCQANRIAFSESGSKIAHRFESARGKTELFAATRCARGS